jgi:DNA-binding XRE family transcriptional regulator/uncharacterized phage-associated protein
MTIVKTLREKNGSSQDAFARELGITRQTLIKYEKSPKDIPALVLKKLSQKFGISMEDIMADRMPKEPMYNVVPAKKERAAASEIRIDIPQENLNKFKEVLLYILEKVGAKPNVGQTVIYKLLYFIDFDFYEIYERQLIGATYIKNHHGPTPVAFAKIIKQMEQTGDLEEIKTKHFQYDKTKYIPVRQADISVLSAPEIKHIDTILEKHSDKTAKELSDYSYKDIPWIATSDNDIIPYESVFYRTPETSAKAY